VPEALDILGPRQGVDDLAEAAGTIGYEILTALGPRYARATRGRMIRALDRSRRSAGAVLARLAASGGS
jgi:hypothetical protein